MNIYIILHKESVGVPTNVEGYQPLLVGACNRSTELREKYLGDDTGENISYLNDSYCEITGLYWIWKNVDSEIVGLEHYRRYFAKIKNSFCFRGEYFCRKKDDVSLLTEEFLRKKLETYDLLINKSKKRHLTMKQIMSQFLTECDFDNIEQTLSGYDPQYRSQYLKHLSEYSYIQFNMFVGRKSVINDYCEWLFPVLAKIDERQRRNTGNRYHNREIGYFAEILFGVWLDANEIRYESAECVIPGQSNLFQFSEFALEQNSNVFLYYEFPKRLMTMLKRLLSVFCDRFN